MKGAGADKSWRPMIGLLEAGDQNGNPGLKLLGAAVPKVPGSGNRGLRPAGGRGDARRSRVRARIVARPARTAFVRKGDSPLSKFSLNKTIEARKLNPKTGVPLPGPETPIPYGAIIEDPHRDRDMWRFTHSHELYRCANDVLTSALDPGALDAVAAPAANVPEPPVAGQTVSPLLRWEAVASSHYSVLRSKVPGGWLIAAGSGPSLAFYPDPEHRWDGASVE